MRITIQSTGDKKSIGELEECDFFIIQNELCQVWAPGSIQCCAVRYFTGSIFFPVTEFDEISIIELNNDIVVEVCKVEVEK
jgi:hypothetical protein